MRAILTRRARTDLQEALRWIARDSLQAANDLNDLVEAAGFHIGANPEIGSHRSMLADLRYRFWPLQRHPYLVIYTNETRPPRIVRVVHSARDLPVVLADLRA